MASCDIAPKSTTEMLSGILSETSHTPSGSSLPNAFGRMMASGSVVQATVKRDLCSRPTPIYSDNYDPYKPANSKLPKGYSPYDFGEPLFDDRAAFIDRFPKDYVLAEPPKKPRTQWVWKLGYALTATKKPSKSTFWSCKLCKIPLPDLRKKTDLLGHHDQDFSKKKDSYFNSNTLKNAENHLRDIHCLIESGDIWKMEAADKAAQASGIVEGSYEKVIPFRQLEFKNAFLEWVMLDDIKHRKACSNRLRRAFKIANLNASKALPASPSTIASWIHEMHAHFEPEIIEEIRTARSRISISFDGWGSKREKISVLGVVIHFLNAKYENVTRLIGLPELSDHKKTGVSKCINFHGL